MPEYLSPGVYVEEVDTGSKPIEGVATSTVGFLGITERGPVAPTLITSFSEYVRVFGRYVQDRFLPYAVEGFFQNGGKRCFVMRVASRQPAAVPATRAIDGMLVSAVGPGTWGNRIAVKVTPASLNAGTPTTSSLFKLTVMYWDVAPPTPIVDPTDPANAQNPNRREPALLEIYDNLSPDPDRNTFYERQVNGFSDLILVTRTPPVPAASTPPTIPTALGTLAAGADGPAVDLDDFKGDPAATSNKRGLFALDQVDEIAILVCPDEGNFAGIADAIIDSCENLKDRFAIVQSLFNAGTVANHRPPRSSKYAAYYYPWLRILDPITKKEIEIPPGGHVAGIYARSDIERGVHKAPANELIRGLISDPQDPARALQLQITKGQQDILNPRGVNVLRYFPGRGPLVWGARTTTLDPDWKYVNVRRLFIFVEESIDEATQWVVFEPNDEPLWARVRRSVSAFLTRLWMDGMLQGRTKEEAYFVRCDRTTMTQADIDNGRLIMLIGIAPVKPAEFVIFRIGQWSGGSEVTEG
jgi:phage tail sheath protein FI